MSDSEAVDHATSFAAPGESFLILASSSSLRKHLTDSYWCKSMEEVCDGQLEGIMVRYTGERLALLQFRPNRLSPAGYRYPLSMSIPVEYLVPISKCGITRTTSMQGLDSFDFRGGAVSSPHSDTPSTVERLCVVCGRYEVPGRQRKHGFKCLDCIGKKSDTRLRTGVGRTGAEED